MRIRPSMFTRGKTVLFPLAIGVLTISLVASTDLNAAAPLIKAAEGLFDQQSPRTLGLTAVDGKHEVLYRASDTDDRYSHIANIAVFKARLYVTWSSGIEHEDHNGQRVRYCYSDDGLCWSKPSVLARDPDGLDGPQCCHNTGLLAMGDTLVAYYGVFPETESHARACIYAMTSEDGTTWNDPEEVVAGMFISSPQQLGTDRLLFCGQRDNKSPRLLYSDSSDGVPVWTESSIPKCDELGYPEPTWFERRDNSIVMLFRSRAGNRWLYASSSTDGGQTWTKPEKTAFPDATSRSFAGNLPDGTAYIINNPCQIPNEAYALIGRRTPLTIALSADGQTFDRAFIIRDEPTTMRHQGKNKLPGYQYPAAIVWNKHLHVVYSINKEDVAMTRIALDHLRQ